MKNVRIFFHVLLLIWQISVHAIKNVTIQCQIPNVPWLTGTDAKTITYCISPLSLALPYFTSANMLYQKYKILPLSLFSFASRRIQIRTNTVASSMHVYVHVCMYTPILHKHRYWRLTTKHTYLLYIYLYIYCPSSYCNPSAVVDDRSFRLLRLYLHRHARIYLYV